MKRIKSLLVLIFLVSNFLQKNLFSQNCVPTGLNNSVITTPCTPICNDLTVQVPDLRSTTSYTVISIPYKPYAFTTAGATTDPTLYADDAYSNIFNLPFPFCFYGNVYTQAVVSSNGLVTFDVKKKNECPDPTQAAWLISSPLPHGGIAGCGSDNYPKLSIMGMFMDLDPRPESSPANRKIEWRVEGTSPCRRFVVSYYNVGLYEDYPCWPTDSSLATFQIVMTESTGVIDVHIDRKQICTNTSGQGRGILGIQGDIPNDNTQYLVVPGKDGNDPA
ncbi:MAG: hypothetical protein KDB92_00805, partial [Chitinophagaceae bacterium]|nr:hypothetical protein [Chitinophagaceae bacterium]